MPPLTVDRRELLYQPGWLQARYVRDVMTMQEIAALIGASRRAVGVALERNGIPPRPAARRFVRRELADAAWLRREYVERSRSTCEIAADLGVTARSVNRALRRSDIALRPPRHHRR